MNSEDSKYFFLDADDPLPKNSYFVGYAFSYGRLAHAEHLCTHELPSALDGAYITIQRDEKDCTIGCDFDGLGRLFVYNARDGSNYWAVSNSFFYLLKQLSTRGKSTTICPLMLKAWKGRGTFFEQLVSFDTSIREISLVPRWLNVRLSSRCSGSIGLRLRYAPRTSYREYGGVSYEHALVDYLETWQERFANLLHDMSHVQIDLSGGLDSRTCFAMLSNLISCENFNQQDKLSIFTQRNPRYAADAKIAEAVAGSRNFSLTHNFKNSQYPSVCETLRNREHGKLGQYALGKNIGPPGWAPGVASISGVGGECVRDFYGSAFNSIEDVPDKRGCAGQNKNSF